MADPTYRVAVYNPASRRIIFFFCPFGIPRWQLALPGLPLWKLRREGFGLVVYDYPLEIANTSPERSIAYIEAVLADVAARIKACTADDVVDIAAYGISLGTSIALNATARHRAIKKLVLNLTYGSIAHHILHVPFMFLVPPKRAARYIAAGGGPAGITATFAPYEPVALASRLTHARVLMFTARHDRLFSYGEVQKFRQALAAAGVKVEYHENRLLGHFSGSFHNHLKHTLYSTFLKSAE